MIILERRILTDGIVNIIEITEISYNLLERQFGCRERNCRQERTERGVRRETDGGGR